MELSRTILRLAAAGLVAFTSCACQGDTAVTTAPAARTPVAAPPTPIPPGELQSDFEKIIKKVLPSIVQITTTQALGSGIVYDTQGHIVTNAHVVGNSRDFSVTLATGGPTRKAKLVSTFPAGDLAVIKVDDARGLAPASFGRSADLQVGQIVLAMGNPLGFSGSVTEGIVSALGRTVTGESHQGSAAAVITNAVQTSAPINPGNSGGALVDLNGKVIGIPTLAAVDPDQGAAPGLGFAIPSDTATDVAQQIVRYGKVVNSRRAALGVRVGTAVDTNGNPIGVVVGSVNKGSGAEAAGIRPGDVIVNVNGTAVTTSNELSQLLATLKPGDKVKIGVQHPNGGKSTVTVTLSELPSAG